MTRLFYILAAPAALLGLFIAFVVIPTVQAAFLVTMSRWDSQDWKIDIGTSLGFASIEGWTTPSHVYFQSVHKPAQQVSSMMGESEALANDFCGNAQIRHNLMQTNFSNTIEYWSSADSLYLFCEGTAYKLHKLNYWAYQNQPGQSAPAWWSGEIRDPKTLEVMAFHTDAGLGQVTIYVQTEYIRADLAKIGDLNTIELPH